MERGAPEAKNSGSLPYPSTGAPLTPGFPLLYEQPGSCSWLGTVAGVALEIKIDPLVAELGCHPGRWQVAG